MNILNKTEFAIFSFLMWTNITNQNLFIFTAAGVVPCGGCKCLPIHHCSADYIFWSFGIIEFIFSQSFENRVPLKPVLGCMAVVAH